MSESVSRSPRDLLRRTHRRRHRRLRRFPLSLDLLRKIAAAACLATAAVLAFQPTGTAGEPTEPLVVAAADLPAGKKLTRADVRTVDTPVEFVPSGAVSSTDAAAGAVLAAAARAGEPLTDARLVGRASRRSDTADVAVRLADAGVADVLRPGTRVDVVTADEHHADEDGGRVLARNATVATVTATKQDDQAPSTRQGRLVVLTLPKDSATRVASYSLNQPLTVTLR